MATFKFEDHGKWISAEACCTDEKGFPDAVYKEWTRERMHIHLTGVTREYDHSVEYLCATCRKPLKLIPAPEADNA